VIRIRCPKCSERLALDDAHAGLVGECPDCGARFRIPAPSPRSADERFSSSRPRAEEEENDEPRSRRPVQDEDDDYRPRRKKRKKRKRSSGDVLSGNSFLIILGVLAAVGLLVVVLALTVPQFRVLAFALGFLIALVGQIWFLTVAFKESVGWGLGCLFVPFVSLIFLAQHFEETWRPWVVGVIGVAMFFAGGGFGPSQQHAFRP
jgi:hypothetical protein